jgi:universal stress protein A
VYSKIIVATDLGPQSLYIAEQALALSRLCKASLLVLHVIEPPLAMTDFARRETEIAQKQTQAQKSLQDLCLQLGVGNNHQFLAVGEGQVEILRVANEQQCDLIVAGSHGVGGYTHALGSTAQHIITNAHCNVLVVQVSHLKDIIEKTVPKATEHPWQMQELRSTTPQFSAPSFGSKKGFGEEVKRGPRLSPRPGGSPYRGGTRKSENEPDPEEGQDP